MKKISTLKNDGDIIVYYSQVQVDDKDYLITLRYSEDGRFISDDSILDLWQDRLDQISWVNPNMSQRFALEVYDRRDGYFNSIGPVIISERRDQIDDEFLKSFFSDVEDKIEEGKSSSTYESDFLQVLDSNNFNNHFVGGGCSIKIV